MSFGVNAERGEGESAGLGGLSKIHIEHTAAALFLHL